MSQYKDELERIKKIIDHTAILSYAEVADDFNPIHVNPEFAAGTPFGTVIAHGMLPLNLVWQSLKMTYGMDVCSKAEVAVRFTRPVHEGDEVSVHGRLRDQKEGIYDVAVENQHGDVVIKGTVRLSRDDEYDR